MFKKTISVLLSLLLTSSLVVSGIENTDTPEVQVSTNYWMDRFSVFEERVDNNQLGELVSSSEMYVKLTPTKEINVETNANYETEVLSKTDYIMESIVKPNELGIGTFSYIGDFEPNGSCSWLRLDLQVYETGQDGKYQAYSFWEWLTDPIFRLTDVGGIHVSSEMIIGNGYRDSQFTYRETHSDTWWDEFPYVTVSQYGNGAAAKFNLPGDSELFNHDSFMGMIGVPVEFSNASSTSGRIFTMYGHLHLALGGELSFDTKGKPSIGITLIESEHSGSTYIAR
jgi:hypothetical protein